VELFGIFHCFTGTLSRHLRLFFVYNIEIGMGECNFLRTVKIDTFLKEIDLESFVVLETDSPYLATCSLSTR